MIASLSVVGCVNYTNSSSSSPTPTAPTATPVATPANADYSSYYAKVVEGAGFIVTQPFAKSISVRGNDVYMGIMKNATLPGAPAMTDVVELAKSQAQAKQLYDNYISTKQNEGYTLRSDIVEAGKGNSGGFWVGQNGPQQFYVFYDYNPYVNSWEVTTEAGSY